MMDESKLKIAAVAVNVQPHSSLVLNIPEPPEIPARSPLRPQARSISSQSTTTKETQSIIQISPTPSTFTTKNNMLDNVDQHRATSPERSGNKSLSSTSSSPSSSLPTQQPTAPSLPPSPRIPQPSSTSSSPTLPHQQYNSSSPPSSPSPPPSAGPQQPTSGYTKRQHALHELLSSERAYASDLALLQEYHIPLALGQAIPLQNVPISPPSAGSSGSSSRTQSTASDSSIASLGPPMTPEDVKIIFSNVAELAMFSNRLSDELERALGTEIEGGTGEDAVGALFLRIIPEMERPFKHYITRHPSALQHLQNLPQTAALQSYLKYTQAVASSLSHAWDLASLLIKPVQRLLKYPLLLNAIFETTPDTHGDKENLKAARVSMEEVAQRVNEGRRRAEVVKDVLNAKGVKKPNASVGVAASVNLSKMKSLRHGGVAAATIRLAEMQNAAAAGSSTSLPDGLSVNDLNVSLSAFNAAQGVGGAAEAARVAALQAELKRIEVFAQQFTKSVLEWGRMASNVTVALKIWALSFGRVIGLSPDQGSQAFEAFLEVVTKGLMPLAADLDAVLSERVLKDLLHLLTTLNQPLKLIASMDEQAPYHYHLLTMPVSQKNRPAPALLAASTNYLALRGQLAAELPAYLNCLHRGIALLVRRLAFIQTRFWRDVRDRWGDLWEMLRVEGEMNAGCDETRNVWMMRWGEVDGFVRALAIAQPVKDVSERMAAQMQVRRGLRELAMMDGYAFPMATPGTPMMPGTPMPPQMVREREGRDRERERERDREREREKGHSSKPSGTSSTQSSPNLSKNTPNVAAVRDMMFALEPSHSPVHRRTSNSGNGLSAKAVASLFGGGGATMAGGGGLAGGVFAVSAPLPLGAYQVAKERERESGKKSRGRGNSDTSAWTTSTMSSSGASAHNIASSNSGGPNGVIYHGPMNTYSSPRTRRTSSQDSLYSFVAGQPTKQQQEKQKLAKSPSRRRTQAYPGDDFAEYVAIQRHAEEISPKSAGAAAPAYPARGAIPRTKSMPLDPATLAPAKEHVRDDSPSTRSPPTTSSRARRASGGSALGRHGFGFDEEGEVVYHSSPVEMQHAEVWEEAPTPREREHRDRGERALRGRSGLSRSNTTASTTASAHVSAPGPAQKSSSSGSNPSKSSKSKERPTHSRNRSGSIKSLAAIFTGSNSNMTITNPRSTSPEGQHLSQRDSWASKPAKYICRVIHPCKPPAAISYYSFPFFTLEEDEFYEVLQEAGHPSIHTKLPLYVDDGEDCLLLCRDGNGIVGWALASFLEPCTSLN